MTDDELSALREKMALAMARTMGGWNDDISEVGIEHEPTRKALEAHWAKVNETCLSMGREYADAILAEFDVFERLVLTVGSGEGLRLADVPTEEEAKLKAFMDEVDVYAHAHEPEEIARLALAYGERQATEEYSAILTRQSDLLTRTAIALKGEPPELTWWSHHDVPELAEAAVVLLASQEVGNAGFEWEAMDERTQTHYLTQARAEIQAFEL